MGRLIVSTQTTVDGVIDVGEWYVADGEHDRAGKDQLGHASAVLLGRKTYEGLAAYWSPLEDDWANLINPMPKYVASRTLRGPLEWNSTLLEGDATDAVSRLKAELPSDRCCTAAASWLGPCSRHRSSTNSDSGFILRSGAQENAPCRVRHRIGCDSSDQSLSIRA